MSCKQFRRHQRKLPRHPFYLHSRRVAISKIEIRDLIPVRQLIAFLSCFPRRIQAKNPDRERTAVDVVTTIKPERNSGSAQDCPKADGRMAEK